MSENNFKKIAASSADAYCRDIDLEEAAKALLNATLSPGQFLELLMANEHHADAVRFLARALPKREATWWACLAVRSAFGGQEWPERVKALTAAEQWVYKPSEENRRLCMGAAEAAGFDNPASWAAMAAFWSSGSLAPPEAPVVPPAEHLTGKAVAGSVMLSAVLTEPEKSAEKYRLFLAQGIDIARGGDGRSIKLNPSQQV